MANEKRIGCCFVGGDILLAAFVPFVLFSVVKKNATQSKVMRVNNKRKHAHQMCAKTRKRALSHTFFNTRLRENGGVCFACP